MISERCNGLNLLNYCKQKNIPKDLLIEYRQIGEKYIKWECILSYSNGYNKIINSSIDIRKREALINVIKKIELDLKDIIGVNKV